MFYDGTRIYLSYQASEMLLFYVYFITCSKIHLKTLQMVLQKLCKHQSSYNSINIAIGGILPSDASWPVNGVLIKEVNKQNVPSHSVNNSCCTFANTLLNPDLFFSDNVHVVEKRNLKFAESIFSSIQNCNSVTCNKHKQFLIYYEMAVYFKF